MQSKAQIFASSIEKLDARYPGYGLAQHKGYPTPFHLEALRQHGPCKIHRRSFAPVAEALLRQGVGGTLGS